VCTALSSFPSDLPLPFAEPLAALGSDGRPGGHTVPGSFSEAKGIALRRGGLTRVKLPCARRYLGALNPLH
jgi:hypothetical protein